MNPLRVFAALVLAAMLAACRYQAPVKDSGNIDSPVVPPDDSASDTDETGTPGEPQLNVLLILTDDQRYDSMWPMPLTTGELGGSGITFLNAYVNTPMCCPARASILAGGYYASETGVRSNGQPNGGVGRFYDQNSMAVRLQEAGYRTGIVGKYLNEYPDIVPYVPPGWDTFEASLTETDWNEYAWVSGSSGSEASTGVETTVTDYITDRVTERSRAFLEADDGRPFFLFVSHSAPHYPMTPDPADDGVYEGETLRAPSFQEEDVRDKPQHVQETDVTNDSLIEVNDERYADAMETLPAVDRSVQALLDALEAGGHTDDTLVIFASDNGFQWGEHRFYSKGLPYEESVRVPLIVRWPGKGTGTREELASVTADVPATIYDVAGIPDTGTQGRSLRQLFEGDATGWPESLYIEGESEGGSYPTWAGLVTADWKYVEYASGESELYDLVNDPYEMESLHDDPTQAARIEAFSEELAPMKGMAIGPIDLAFTVGEPVDEPLPVVGGTAPFTWSMTDGALPPGLSLSSDGRITGTPSGSGRAAATFRVVGSSVSAFTGERHDDLQVGFVSVDAAATVRFTAPPAVVGGPAAPRLRFALTEDLPVVVLVGPSPDFDDNPRRLVPRRMGPGRYELDLAGLKRGATWFYRVQAAGRLVESTGSFTVP